MAALHGEELGETAGVSAKGRFDATTAIMCGLAVMSMLCPWKVAAAGGVATALYAAARMLFRWPDYRRALQGISLQQVAASLRQPPLLHIFVYLAVLALLLQFSTNVKSSALAWARTLLFLGSSLLALVCLRQLSNRPDRTRWIVHALLLGNAVNAGYGLYEAHVMNYRHVSGLCANYIFFAVLLVATILLASALLLAERKPSWRALYAGLICLYGIALVYANARGPMIALVLSIAVVVYLSRRLIAGDPKWARLCLGAGAVLILALAPLYIRHLLTVFDPAYQSNWERVLIWKSSLHMIRDHPWSGVGYGQFAAIYNTRYISPASIERWHPHAHDLFLQVTAENGLIGLAVSLYLLWGVTLFLRNAHRRAPLDPLVIGTAGVFCALFVGSFVDFFLLSGFLHLEWVLWLLLGLVYYDHPPSVSKPKIEPWEPEIREPALA